MTPIFIRFVILTPDGQPLFNTDSVELARLMGRCGFAVATVRIILPVRL